MQHKYNLKRFIYERVGMLVILISLLAVICAGCGNVSQEQKEGKEIPYTVVADKEIPDALREKLEERKGEPFKVTFADQGYIYICVGYGEQQSGGYSIGVKDLYEMENAIYVDTLLTGPAPEEVRQGGRSYPYIVIKTEYQEKAVVFE